MLAHRRIIAPKFAAVVDALSAVFGASNEVSWNKPRGGYFVSVYVRPGTAHRVIELARMLGVELTPEGSAFPYGKDPKNWHIRIAPTSPPLADVIEAMRAVVLSIKIALAE